MISIADAAEHQCATYERSALDGAGGLVPHGGKLAEEGFVGHVAGQRGVVAEDDVLGDWLARTNRLEIIPQMRLQIVEGITGIGEAFGNRLLAWDWIVLLVPLLLVFGEHRAW